MNRLESIQGQYHEMSENINSLSLQPEHFEFLHLIGQGPFSDVYLARCRLDLRRVAIKILKYETIDYSYAQYRKELVFWQSLAGHPNFGRVFGAIKNGSSIWIFMEFVNGGSIYDILQFGYFHGFRDEILIATILREILSFLCCIHKKSMIHRHLQTSSVLVDESGQIKIVDYAYSAGLIDDTQRNNTRLIILGTPCYTAPEIITGNYPVKTAADIWSLGMIAIELAFGETLHSELTPMEQIIAIIGEGTPQINKERISPHFLDFISLCLKIDPNERPSAIELLKHPFIRKGQDSSYIEKVLMKGLPKLEERVLTLNGKKLRAQNNPFIGHENPVFFRFDLKDLEENGAQNPENLVKTHVGNFVLTIKEPKFTPICIDLNGDSSLKSNMDAKQSITTDKSQSPPDNKSSSKMTLNDIVNKVTEIEMKLASIEMDNFEMTKKLNQYSKIISEIKGTDNS